VSEAQIGAPEADVVVDPCTSLRSLRDEPLAICLGHVDGLGYYYSQYGQCFALPRIHTLFTMKNFASATELQPVLDALPFAALAESASGLANEKLGPSREVGAHLLRKMTLLVKESENVYRAHAAKLDNAFHYVGRAEEYVASLYELADALLPGSSKIHGRFPDAALFAVHKVLRLDAIGFRPADGNDHHRYSLFEVSRKSDRDLCKKMLDIVRDHYYQGKAEAEFADVLDSFASRARRHIQESRKCRQWTPHGTLGPLQEQPLPPLATPKWEDVDILFIRFLYLWASCEKFTQDSGLDWVGAGILRALDCYADAEVLTRSTGWTCLQELGWIAPWDVSSRYAARLTGLEPSTTGFERIASPLDGGSLSIPQLLSDDLCNGHRRDWGQVKAYCIDAESTVEVDDAISLETVGTEGEFLVHIHVADPGSRIQPHTPLAYQAELLPLTSYLAGHFEAMLADENVRQQFSLGTDTPCLTFTARLNLHGEILHTDISPGVLRNVVYITPEEVSKVCEADTASKRSAQEVFIVGRGVNEMQSTPNRTMTKAEELTHSDVNNLRILSMLAKAVRGARLSQGALPSQVFRPRPEVQVHFDQMKEGLEDGQAGYRMEDPKIVISGPRTWDEPASHLVHDMMTLAGHIAARWCHVRDIPIPYRTQPHAARKLEEIRKLTPEYVHELQTLGRATQASQQKWRSLLGPTDISTTPGFFVPLGIDMYTKATSPLRRFGDLIVHWQIHAALRHERETGVSLVRADDAAPRELDFLPFTKQQLDDDVLVSLAAREKSIARLDRLLGPQQYMLQALVRAWRFGEAELPRTFRFRVGRTPGGRRNRVVGWIDWFDQVALMDAGAGSGLESEAIRTEDEFEVELKDVDVHGRDIIVKPLRRWEKPAGL
jgi:hypothetical protein